MADNGTVGAVLQNKASSARPVDNGASVAGNPHVKRAIVKYNPKAPKYDGPSKAEIEAANADESQWQWVEIPDHDLFGEAHTGVSVNFDKFTPGKYYVSPELASELKRLLQNRLEGDMRVLQPRQDMKMAQIMRNSQLGAPINSNLDGLHDR